MSDNDNDYGGATYDGELGGELRDVVRHLVDKHSSSDAVTAVAWPVLGEAGVTGLEVPEELGGAGVSFTETVVVAEELGAGSAASAFLGNSVLGVGCLLSLAPTPDRDALLSQVVAGDAQVTVVLGAHGELAGDHRPAFVLRRTPDGLTLDGSAAFVPDALGASTLLLLAEDDGDPVVVAIDPEALQVAGVEVVDETRSLASVVADGVRVQAAQVWSLAGDAHAAVARLHDRAAIALAADSVGVCAAALSATVDYVRIREQFGRPIGSFQAVKHACADMFVTTTVARELLGLALQAYSTDPASASVPASMAKAYAAEAAVRVAGQAMQLHGGIGYAWESGIHRLLKRATLNRVLLGSPAAHRALISRKRDYAAPVLC